MFPLVSQKKLLLALAVLSVRSLSDAQAAPAPPDKVKTALAVLPAPSLAQQETLAYLEQKCGEKVPMPSYPADALLDWTRQNFAEAGRDPQLLYRAVYEQLLVAQPLLAN